MIAKGSDSLKAYVGSTEVSKMYLGDILVYSSAPAPLPYDAQVEYLQSSGTQYIQLPLTVNKSSVLSVEVRLMPVGTSTGAIFGANPYAQFTANYYSNSDTKVTYSSRVGNATTNGGFTLNRDEMNTLVLSTTGKTVNGVYTSLSRPLTVKITAFRIFGGYQNTFRCPVAIGEFVIKVDGTAVYDLISVRKDGVGYLYDRLTGELHGNSGSNSFTYGADVV